MKTLQSFLLFTALFFGCLNGSFAADHLGVTGTRNIISQIIPGAHFCSVLLKNYSLERIIEKFGPESREAYFYAETILSPRNLHPESKIRKLAYQLFTDYHADPGVINILSDLDIKVRKAVILKLIKLEEATTRKVLATKEAFETFANQDKETVVAQEFDPGKFLLLGGVYVLKKQYEQALKIQKKFESRGVTTQLSALSTGPNNGVYIEFLSVTGNDDFFNEQFQKILALANTHQIRIGIDCSLHNDQFTAAYFTPNRMLIALRENSSKSTFIHEWTHAVDIIVNPTRYQNSLLSSKIDYEQITRDASPFKRALYRTAMQLEYGLTTEMNATTQELQLPNNKISDLVSALLYHDLNGTSLAMSLAVLEQENPNHYLNAVKYFVGYSLPYITLYKAMPIAVQLVFQ